MSQSVIYDLLIILAAGLFAGVLCRWIQVSVLIGYLVVGAFLGEGLLGWVLDETHQLEHFAEAGVFLLLFTIGLEFSLDEMGRLGRNLIIGGTLQMTLVALPVGSGLLVYGYSWQASWLVAAALSFSSTVLVFKALSEWGQATKPQGVRAVGILLFQDAALVPLLLLIPLLTGDGEKASAVDYVVLALVSVLFVTAIVGLRRLLMKWIIPKLADYRSPELVILFTIVALGGVTLAAYKLGLPPTVGAFAAGLIFNGNRWTKQIDALVLPFRETFAAIFFVGLGLIFDVQLFWQEPIRIVALLLLTVLIKAFAATAALLCTGLRLRQSFGIGIGLAHVGEFAFVVVLLGLETGVLDEEMYRLVVTLAVGSLILTPPLMKIGLRLVTDQAEAAETRLDTHHRGDVAGRALVIGAGPIGRQVASQLELAGKDVCLIDLSPINLHPFAQEGFRTVAGDASKADILRLADVETSELVAVCIPHDESALLVVRAVRLLAPAAMLIVRCRYQSNFANLRRAGADHVVSEEAEASLAILNLLTLFESQK